MQRCRDVTPQLVRPAVVLGYTRPALMAADEPLDRHKAALHTQTIQVPPILHSSLRLPMDGSVVFAPRAIRNRRGIAAHT